jgi:hypothetical protein
MSSPDLLPDPFDVIAFQEGVAVFHPATPAALAITPQAALETGRKLIEAAERALAPDAPPLGPD